METKHRTGGAARGGLGVAVGLLVGVGGGPIGFEVALAGEPLAVGERAGKARVGSVQAGVTNQFDIQGMHCDGCARGLAAELRRVPGVTKAEVSFPKRLAVVVYETNRVSVATLMRTVEEAGYQAKPRRVRGGERR